MQPTAKAKKSVISHTERTINHELEDQIAAALLTPKPKRCYLLEVPGEIRNRIYEEPNVVVFDVGLRASPNGKLVNDPKPIYLYGKTAIWTKCDQPAISRACRQLRSETLPMFYGCNVFYDTDQNPACVSMLSCMTVEQRSMLRHLRLRHSISTGFGHDRPYFSQRGDMAEEQLAQTKQWLDANHPGVNDGAIFVLTVAGDWTCTPLADHQRVLKKS